MDSVRSRSRPGDKFTVWSVAELVQKNLHLFSGAYPQHGQGTDLIVPPRQLDRVRAYLEVVEPKYAPHHMNEVLAIYSSSGGGSLKSEIVNLHYADDWDEFVGALRTHSHPGAEVHLFPVSDIDREENILLEEKYPNEKGEVPIGGAY